MLSFKWLFQLEHTYCVKAIYIARNFKINLVNVLYMLCSTRDFMALHSVKCTSPDCQQFEETLLRTLCTASFLQSLLRNHSQWMVRSLRMGIRFFLQSAWFLVCWNFSLQKDTKCKYPDFSHAWGTCLMNLSISVKFFAFHRFQNRPC